MANSPNRIALVYWGTRGGGSLVTLGMAERLAGELGPDNVLISIRDTNEDLVHFHRSELPLVPIRIPKLKALPLRVREIMRTLRRLAQTIAEFQPAIVVFTMNFPLAWPFIHFLHARGLRVAYLAHDASPHPGDYASLWQSSTQTLLLHLADRILTLSEHVAQVVRTGYPRKSLNVRMIPLDSVLPPRQGHVRSRGEGPARLLFLGRLISYKGLDVLAEALRPLREDPRWTLTLSGAGPLEQLVRETFKDWKQVTLALGWQPKEQFDRFLAEQDILLCPYIEASQSGVVAEAMAYGLPSIVMPNGALPEQVGNGRAGLICEYPSSEAYTQAIKRILAEPHLIPHLSAGALALSQERQRHPIAPNLLA